MTRIFRAIVFSLAGLGLLMVVVSCTPLVTWWATKLAGNWSESPGDILIVLGGSTLDNGTIGGGSYWRAIYGALAYKNGGFRQVVITGGGPEGIAAAPLIGAYLESQGVPRQNIRLETKSLSTRENALFTRDIVRDSPGRKVLLTSDYHMYRAYRAFLKAGVETTPRPFPDIRKRAGSWVGRWPAFLDLILESTKIVYYRVHGWI